MVNRYKACEEVVIACRKYFERVWRENGIIELEYSVCRVAMLGCMGG